MFISPGRASRFLAVAVLAVALFAAAACSSSSSNKSTPTVAVKNTVAGAQAPSPTGAAATPAAPGAPLDVSTTGTQLSFSPNQLNATANSQITIRYTNNSPLPHNIHFFNGKDANAPSLAMTDIATGPNAVHTATFQAPAPGTYFFHCDVHPTQMTGQLIVK